ncbi:hypothetical protein KAI87_01325 [Myxococcota bacterium]|nr:hypothetical protein [Myxococcota bacterium]
MAIHPKQDIAGVVVYLHGANDYPLADDPRLVSLLDYAQREDLILLRPLGAVSCEKLKPPRPKARCWEHSQIKKEIEYVTELVQHVTEGKLANARREIVGYSNGGYLVAGAIQKGLLSGWKRAGIIAGGIIGMDSAAFADGYPDVFIEIGRDDKWQLEPSRRLHQSLNQAGYQHHYRETDDGHELSSKRIGGFLAWISHQEH